MMRKNDVQEEGVSFDKVLNLFYLLNTMPLTLNQFLLLVLALAVVIGISVLVMLAIQLRKTAKEGERTLSEIRTLAKDAQTTNAMIQKRLEETGETLQAAKKAAGGISEFSGFLMAKFIQPSSKYWPFIFPLLKMGMRQIRKRKNHKEE